MAMHCFWNAHSTFLFFLFSLTGAVNSNREEKVRLDTSLSVWIIEAKGIPLRKRYFCEVLLDKVLFARTSVKCKNDMLFWGEQFNFDDLPPTESLTICLYRESDTKKKRKAEKHVFIGSSVIDLLKMETNTENEKWVSVYVPGVSPKLSQKAVLNNNSGSNSGGSNSGSSNNKADQPFIRAKFKYETTVVLPAASYNPLHDFVKKNYLVLASTLEATISLKTKDNLAQTLLKIFQANDTAEQFLVDVIMNEVANTADENLTFRGNSLATKSIDTYMKMIGKNYLQETLGAFIATVYESEEDCEVDPQKITSPNVVLADNQKYLLKLVEEVWRNIFLSVNSFPKKLRTIFSMVREKCESQGRSISKKIVSASLFLRFLCPAILSPSLFQLTQEYPCEKVARTLTLVAKTIQNLANFTRFGSKESYMEILNEFVESEMSNMDNFLQAISFSDAKTEPSSKPDSSHCNQNVDLARELSVLYHILKVEVPNLPANDAKKLETLKPILGEITKIHNKSPKADELRLSRPFATVASVCSKPLTTPSSVMRDDTHSTSTTPATNSTVATPSSTILEDAEYIIPKTPECYKDTCLSYSEDYVSGCSLVQHRNSPSRNLAKRNEGRGTMDRKRLLQNQSLSSTPDHQTQDRINGKDPTTKRSKSVDPSMHSRVNDGKGKFDKLLSVSSQAALNKSQKQMKSDPSLNSLKKRQQDAPSPSQKPSPLRKGNKDSSNSVKDRISLFSQKDSSTKTAKTPTSKTPVVTPTKPSVTAKSFLGNKSLLSKKTPKTQQDSPQPASNITKANSRKSASLPASNKSAPPSRNGSAPLGVAEPKHANGVNNKNVPSTKPTTTDKPSVPKKPIAKKNGKEENKVNKAAAPVTKTVGKTAPNSLKSNSMRSLGGKASPPVKIDEKNSASTVDRNKLKLGNLKKEHHFEEPTSPELMSYEKSPKRNLSEREIFSQIESQLDLPHHQHVGGPPNASLSSSRQNTLRSTTSANTSQLEIDDYDDVSWSSKLNLPTKHDISADPRSTPPVSQAYIQRHEQRNNVFSSVTMLPNSSTDSPDSAQFRQQRRHSEMTPYEMEKKKVPRSTMLVTQNEDIAEVNSNGYREVLHEGVVERCNSISSCESSCEYSSDSYYTSEEEVDYGIFIEGDKMADVLMEHEQKMNGDSRYDLT